MQTALQHAAAPSARARRSRASREQSRSRVFRRRVVASPAGREGPPNRPRQRRGSTSRTSVPITRWNEAPSSGSIGPSQPSASAVSRQAKASRAEAASPCPARANTARASGTAATRLPQLRAVARRSVRTAWYERPPVDTGARRAQLWDFPGLGKPIFNPEESRWQRGRAGPAGAGRARTRFGS